MRLVTLNIRHGGGKRGERLAAFLTSLRPDVVVLTEFRNGDAGRALGASLTKAGLITQAVACTEPRQNSVCIASSLPFRSVQLNSPAGHEHRLLLADFGALLLLAAYFPQGEAKRPVFEHLRVDGVPALGARGIIVGDLNTGLPRVDEFGDTFFCSDAFSELLADGLVDSWRIRNPEAREFTWYSTAGNGFRIDHALCTPALNARVATVRYLHECREDGMTDHSALLVDIEG